MSRTSDPSEWVHQPPVCELQQVQLLSAEGPGFLTLRRRELVVAYDGGAPSAPFAYDEIDRSALDAVVLCAYYYCREQCFVYLRSAVRPPLAFRDPSSWHEGPCPAGLWELPAGLVEAEERGPSGVRSCAARELEEELGFRVAPREFERLGSAVLPAPAVLAEQQFFFRVEVDPDERRAPTLDGSALEHGGKVIAVPVPEALDACRRGWLADGKTELGLRRLAEALSER